MAVGHITMREIVKITAPFWLFLAALFAVFVLSDFGVLSDNDAGKAIKITVCVYLPLQFSYLLLLRYRRRNSM